MDSLAANKKGLIDGFVDLGAYTTPNRGVVCDHGLVLLFEPLTHKWQQILEVCGSRDNVKADVLSILLRKLFQ